VYSGRPTTRACMTVIDWMNYAARRQLKEKCFRTVIHSVTSTRLLFKHGGSQVAAQMTSLITRGFDVLHCLLRAGETTQVYLDSCSWHLVFVLLV
jgi:hypothetical protein